MGRSGCGVLVLRGACRAASRALRTLGGGCAALRLRTLRALPGGRARRPVRSGLLCRRIAQVLSSSCHNRVLRVWGPRVPYASARPANILTAACQVPAPHARLKNGTCPQRRQLHEPGAATERSAAAGSSRSSCASRRWSAKWTVGTSGIATASLHREHALWLLKFHLLLSCAPACCRFGLSMWHIVHALSPPAQRAPLHLQCRRIATRVRARQQRAGVLVAGVRWHFD